MKTLMRPVYGLRPRPPVALPAREAICTGCQWNVNWLCEHPGCATCSGKQRRTGGLRIRLADPNFRCAAGKF